MFDRYHIGGGHSSVSAEVMVNEHRAPTDESVKIYDELREKATRSIVSAGVEELSAELMQWTLTQTEPMRWVLKFFVTVNGRREEGQVAFNGFDVRIKSTDEQAANFVREKVVAAIKDIVERAIYKQLFREGAVSIVSMLRKMRD